MDRAPRRLWGLLAVGGAIAVGITTHDAGWVILTLFGTLFLPRILGLRGPGWHHGHGCHGHGQRADVSA